MAIDQCSGNSLAFTFNVHFQLSCMTIKCGQKEPHRGDHIKKLFCWELKQRNKNTGLDQFQGLFKFLSLAKLEGFCKMSK